MPRVRSLLSKAGSYIIVVTRKTLALTLYSAVYEVGPLAYLSGYLQKCITSIVSDKTVETGDIEAISLVETRD